MTILWLDSLYSLSVDDMIGLSYGGINMSEQLEVEVIPAEVEIIDPENMTYQDSVDIIREELKNMKESFMRIGCYLKHIKEHKMYLEDGYANIYEFADDKLHISRSTTIRLINLCRQFSRESNPMQLDQKYEGYTYSQLVLLSSMKEEQRAQVNSKMTVQQIRQIKKESRKAIPENLQADDAVGDIETNDGASLHHSGVAEIQAVEAQAQPELKIFRNDMERKKWIEDVEAWGLWYEDTNIQARYYKYDFPDGSRVIAVKYRYTCQPYMKELPWHSQYNPEEDGCYGENAFYHMIYSEEYWEKIPNRHQKSYEKFYTNDTVTEDELIEFLQKLQSSPRTDGQPQDDVWTDDIHIDNDKGIAIPFDRSYMSNEYIIKEFDPEHLGKKENKEKSYITRQYIKFYVKKGYIPRYFNVKNCTEVTDAAATLATSCGSKSGIGSIAFFYVKEEVLMIINDETIEEDKALELIKKLLHIAAPDERKEAEEILLKCRK